MLKEETIEIKKCLEVFTNFTVSHGSLEKQELSYGVGERKINGDAGEVLKYTESA